MKKLLFALIVVAFMASPVWAGNIPEFDAVGCDASNIFAANNGIQYGQVIDKNGSPTNPKGLVNNWSDFIAGVPNYVSITEGFWTDAADGDLDPCFGEFRDGGYLSALTDAGNEGVYIWKIVLQMKPESDINVNIYDCVIKHNNLNSEGLFDLWTGADQTGRYRSALGKLAFVKDANPTITVKAYPGRFAVAAFKAAGAFTMDARLMPTLDRVLADGVLYTSKALWSEGIVLAMPQTGSKNMAGVNTYNLKQGDLIEVTIQVPPENTVDIFYGQDNVILKYVGVYGTWLYDDTQCAGTSGT